MKFSIKNFKGKMLKLKVKNTVVNGKNIYKDIKGHENEINEVLIDLSPRKTRLKRLIVCLNFLYPGKVNREYKMTRGHSHNAEEVYLFLNGKGKIILGKRVFPVKKGDIVTVPANVWHRTVNTGKDKLIYLTIFERHEHSHLKKQ
jgi:glucose-6-phosphate isomerase